MIRKILKKLDQRLQSGTRSLQSAGEVEPSREDLIDVLLLEDRILYSASPLADPHADADPAVDPNEGCFPQIGHTAASTVATSLLSAGFQSDNADTEPNDAKDAPTDASHELAANSSEFCDPTDDSSIRKEIVFLDSGVENFDQLLDDVLSIDDPNREIEVVLLSAQRDGVDQITQVLSRNQDLDAIHIVSHGGEGSIQLGNTALNRQTLDGYAGDIAGWASALTSDADILLYGCDLASGQGTELIDSLSTLTETDVAASDDLTGHADLGGDWEFEYTVGQIDADLAFSAELQQGWFSTLATINVDTTVDENDGDTSSIANLVTTSGGTGISLREAIIAANNTAGADVIVLGPGIYNLDITGDTEQLAATGDLDILTDITINGNSPNDTVIDATHMLDRVFHVDASGSLTLSQLTVTGGAGDVYEAGAVFNEGVFVGTDLVFRDNSAINQRGGAIYSTGTTSLSRVSLIDNQASDGGALNVEGGVTTLTNVTISGNTSTFDGGAIRVSSGSLNIDYATIANNEAVGGNGGGIQILGGTTNVSNSIIADNTSQFGGADVNNSLTTDTNNLIEDNDGVVGTDPGLMGLTEDAISGQFVHVITDTNAAFDSGGGTPPSDDIRGVARDARADIGSYEYVPEAPSDLEITSTDRGGLSLNEDGGNNAYLIADDGAAILGGLTEFSIEAQLTLGAAPPTFPHIIDYAIAGQDGEFSLLLSGDTVRVSVAGLSYGFSGTYTQLRDGNVHTIGVTRDSGGVLRLYIDGIYQTQLTGTDVALGTGGSLVVGNDQDAPGGSFSTIQYLEGTLYDLRVFSGVRSDAQMSTAFRSDVGYDEQNLLANWTFDESSTDGVFKDNVSGNNLTLRSIDDPLFTESDSGLTLRVDENAISGSVVGTVEARDLEREVEIAAILAADSNLIYDEITGKFYRHVNTSSNWTTALATATSDALNGVSGQLVTIHSAFENQLIWDMATADGSNVWLGASDQVVEGEYRWYEGSTAGDLFWVGDNQGFSVDGAYQNWNAADPNNFAPHNFGFLSETDGSWWDVEDTNWATTVIEWDADAVLDATESLTYSIQNQTIAGALAIDNDTGQITVADGSLLDYETNSTHVITVRTTDGDSNFYDQDVTISLNDLAESNNAPLDLSTGIELNTDGGNNAYLVDDSSGVPYWDGLESITMEFQVSGLAVPDTISTFYSKEAIGSSSFFGVEADGTLNWTGITSTNTYSQLFDGGVHSVAFSWDAPIGGLRFYVDGELAEVLSTATQASTMGGGTFVLGQDQDSVGGSFDPVEAFSGTFHDVRVWDHARSEAEIANHYQQKFDPGSLPSGLLANWQMDGFDVNDQVVDIVSGNNLSIGQAPDPGFTTSNPVEELHVQEASADGTTVGYVIATDPDTVKDIVDDGLFLDAPDPGSFTRYTAGQTFGGWTVESGDVDLLGNYVPPSPLGGRSVELNGSTAGTIVQSLTTEIGREYQVTFVAAGNFSSGSDPIQFRASAGGIDQTFVVTEGNDWSLSNPQPDSLSFTFTAQSTESLLRFESMTAGSFSVGIGDVQVHEIPAAVSAILSSDTSLSYDAGTGKFYRFVNTVDDFNTHLTTANSSTLNGVSGQLVTIRSAYENELIRQFTLESGNDIWLGATDANNDGNWNWLDGSSESNEQFWIGGDAGSVATGYYASAFGQSESAGEDYVRMKTDGTWADESAGSNNALVIEWDASQVLSNFTFSLSDDAAGRFEINTSTGEITVADGSLLNHAVNPVHTVTVEVTDATGNVYGENMTIKVDGENQAPTFNAWESASFGTANEISSAANNPRAIDSADVDGDGDLDIVSASLSDHTVAWYENDGTQSYQMHVIDSSATGTRGVVATDLDGDGDIDFVSANYSDNTIAWYENDGNESFTKRVVSNSATTTTHVQVADVDADGDLDILSANYASNTIAWYENDGSESFIERVITNTANSPYSVGAADVDGDGDLDVVGTSSTFDAVYWFENDGSQNFTQRTVTNTADGARSVTTGDFDGDGDLDILAASSDDATVAWYENDGSQSFTERLITTSADGANFVFSADLDSDGDLDILTASYVSNVIDWWENDGVGGFTQTVISNSQSGALTAIADDVDGDGDLDVLANSWSDDVIAWYENSALVSSLDENPTYVEDISVVVLDRDVPIFDAELSAIDDFGGSSLTLVRNGGANSDDTFHATGNLVFNGGTLELSAADIGTYTNSGGQLVLSFASGTTNAQVNEAMRSIAYSNVNDTLPTSVQIDWTFDDGNTGEQGSGSALQATGYTIVNLVDMPDPASLTVPIGQAVNEDASFTFSSAGSNAIVLDIDSPYSPTVTATLSVSNGTLSLGSTNGISFLDGTSDGASNITIAGTAADINAALDGLQYTGDPDFNGSDTLTITTGLELTAQGDLYARYEFTEGTLYDASGNGYTGVSNGDPTPTIDAERGHVLQFDGDDFINIANGTAGLAEEVTIAAWVNLDANEEDAVFLSLGDEVYVILDPSNPSYGIGGHVGGFSSYSLNSGHRVAGAGWHHVALTLDDTANEMRVYLDGQLIRSSNYSGMDADWGSAASQNMILGGLSDGTNAFVGSMDDVRVYERALTQTEIASILGDLGYAAESVDITVDPVNDAPVLVGYNPVYSTTEDASPFQATVGAMLASSVSDVDSAAVEGIAVYNMTDSVGMLEYTVDGGTNWQTFSGLSSTSALLLRATDSIRFTPNGVSGGSMTLDYYAWDQTSGTEGTTANVTSRGDSTAFSLADDTVTVDVSDINDEQVLATNTGATFLEGSFGNTITSAMLETTDVDPTDTPDQIVYTITVIPAYGDLYVQGIRLNAGETFTQADINVGDVTYGHFGGEDNSDGFEFDVDDGTGSSISATFNITITAFDDAPTLGNNALTISEGGQAILSSTILSATDVDTNDASLTFTLSNVDGLQFRQLANNVSVTTFTQAQVTAGEIVVTHDGSNAAPSYEISVSDGTTTTAPAASAISFSAINDRPYLDASGLFEESVVNTTTAGEQVQPETTILANGNYVILWDDGSDVRAQIFQPDATPVGTELVLDDTAIVGATSIASTQGGGFSIAWFDGTDIRARGFDATGTAIGASVVVASGTQSLPPEIVQLGGGKHAVVYYSGGDVQVQMLTEALALDGSPIVVPDVTTGAQTLGNIVALQSGGFAVAFADANGRDGESHGVFLQRFDLNGTPVGSNVQVNQNTAGSQRVDDMAELVGGEIVVTWRDNTGDGAGNGVFMRIFDATGTAVTNEILVPQSTAGHQDDGNIAILSDGSFAVTWQSAGANGQKDAFIRHFASDGTALSDEILINTDANQLHRNPQATLLPDDQLAVTWSRGDQSDSNYEIVQRHFDFNGYATTYTEGGSPVLLNDQISLIDFDDTNLEEATIQIAANYESGADYLSFVNQNGITGVWDAGTGTLTLSGPATVEDYETALRSVTFGNLSLNPSSATRQISWSVSDGDATSYAQTSRVEVAAANNDPVLTLQPGGGTYTENGSGTFIDTNAIVSDVDSLDFDGGVLSVNITGNSSADDRLAINHEGMNAGEVGVTTGPNQVFYGGTLIGTWSGMSSPLSISFNSDADATAVQQVVRNIVFFNVSDDPSTLQRTIEMQLTDGDGGTSVADTRLMNVVAYNDDPTNAGSLPTDVSVTEDVVTNVDLSSINLADLDVNGGDLILKLTTSTGGLLSVNSILGVTPSGDGTSSLTLEGSLADLNTLLQDLTAFEYSHPTEHLNGDNADTITVEVNDNGNTGIGGGGDVLLGSMNVDITATNDAPVLDLDADDSSPVADPNFLASFTEGGGPVSIVDTDALLSDVDDLNLESITVTLNATPDGAHEVLAANTTGTSITASYDSGTGELSLSGTDTVANYLQVLKSVTYDNTSDDPDASVRTIIVVANDGEVNSNSAVSVITMTVVNDAPDGSNNTVATGEDTDYVFTVADFGFNDAEGDNFERVYITSLPSSGELLYSGSTFAAGNFISAIDLDAGLLVFRPTSGENGVGYANFQFEVMDDGGTANGGVDRDPIANTMTIDVSDLNSISGTIWEDVDGNADLADAIEIANVDVHLYDGTGTYVTSTVTDVSGVYVFQGVSLGDFYVVVDSRTIVTSGGLNSGFTSSDVWAEQTWGIAGAVVDDGAGGTTQLLVAGAAFGGASGGTSDDASSFATSEHVTFVSTVGGDVSGVDSAFSFNVVTHVGDGDLVVGEGRSMQGSLRQFVDNANAMSGDNAMRFVPAVDANSTGGSGDWWTVTLTDNLSAITDDGTTIDGTAFSKSDGVTVLDTNTGTVNSSRTVGVDGLILSTVDRQELEIDSNGQEHGIIIDSHNTTVRDLSSFGAQRTTGVTGNQIYVMPTVTSAGGEATIAGLIIGARADGSDPGAGNRTSIGANFDGAVSATNNYFAFLDATAARFNGAASGNTDASLFVNNEIAFTGWNHNAGDGLTLDSENTIVRGNYIHDILLSHALTPYTGKGIELWSNSSFNTIVNNTIENTVTAGIGIGGNANNNSIARNVISNVPGSSGNAGTGILVTAAAGQPLNNTFTQNSISDVNGIGIDIDPSTIASSAYGDGPTSNDGLLSTGEPHQLIDSPVLQTVNLESGNLTLAGYVGSAAGQSTFAASTVEFFVADAGGSGQTYLGSIISDANGNFSGVFAAGSVSDTDSIVATATLVGSGTSEFGSGFAVNTPPSINTPIPQSVDEDQPLSISGLSVSDSNSNVTSVALSVANGNVTVSLQGAASISLGSNNSAALTISGTQADINSTLATIVYQGDLNYFGSDTLNIIATDSSGTTDTSNLAITINAINDAPTLSVNNGMSVAEGGSQAITSAMLAEGDPDDDGTQVTYTVTSAPTAGQLEFTDNPGAAVFSFTQQDIANNRLIYVHDGVTTGNDSFNFTLADGGEDGASSIAGMFDITVANVNESPVFTSLDGNPTYTENAIAVVLDNDVTISDPELSIVDDFGGSSVTLRRTGGAVASDSFGASGNVVFNSSTLELSAAAIGTVSTASGQVTLTFNAGTTNAQVNEVLQSLTYHNTSEDPDASVTIRWAFDDGNSGAQGAGGNLTATGFTTVDIVQLNDDPTLGGSIPMNAGVLEDTLSSIDLSAVNLTDADARMGSLLLRLSTSTGGLLYANNSAGVTVSGSGTNTLTLSGSLADLNTFIDNAATVGYQHSLANTNGDAADSITIDLNDQGNTGLGGGGFINLGSLDIDIAAINDDPINTGTIPTTVIVAEDVPSDIDLSSVQLQDVDATTGTLTLTLRTGSGGTLSAVTSVGVLASGSGTGTLTLEGTVSDLNAFLSASPAVQYTSVPNANGTMIDSIQIEVNDNGNTGTGGGAAVLLGSVRVDVLPTNDAPNLNNAFDLRIPEVNEDSLAPIGTTIADLLLSDGGSDPITDLDTGALEGIAVTSTDELHGRWQYSIDSGATWNDFGVTSENAARLLGESDLIRFVPNADYFGPSGDLTFRAWDQSDANMPGSVVDVSLNGGLTPFSVDTESVTTNVIAMNDDPVNLGVLPTDISVAEDTVSVLDLSAIVLNDVDAGTNALTLTLNTSAGGRILAATGTGIAVGGSNTTSVTLTGSLIDLNAYLNSTGNLLYSHPTVDYSGNDADQLTILINDNGSQGAGGGNDVLIGTANIDIANTNDAPSALGESFVMDEDTTLGGNVLLNDSDADNDPLSVILVNGPTTGTLQLNADGSFTYTPALDEFGNRSFSYRVTDGTAVSDEVTALIDVSPVNDAPVAVDDNYAILPGNSLELNAATGLVSNDIDLDGDSLSVIIVSQPTHGTLTVISNGSLSYVPDPNFAGFVTFSYQLNDGTATSSVASVTIFVSQGVSPTPNTGFEGEPPVETEVLIPISETLETASESKDSASTSSNVSQPILRVVSRLAETVAEKTETAEEEEEKSEGSPDQAEDDTLIYRNQTYVTSNRQIAKVARSFNSNDLEQLLMQFSENVALKKQQFEVVSGTANGLFIGATALGALWLASGSSLVALLASSLPAWAQFDPIFIVTNRVKPTSDDVTVAQIIQQRRAGKES